ncbi:diguanylate cyclase [Ectothiorhodospira mobilis]|nr:diguanylate cyclase [Ectothiorhodospira mobilis]
MATLPLARLRVDRVGDIHAANETAADLLGAQIGGDGTMARVADFFAGEDPGVLDHLLEEARGQGGSLARDLHLKDAGGRAFRADLLVLHASRKDPDPAPFLFILAERMPSLGSPGDGETTLRHFYDLHAVGMALISPEGRAWLGFNERFREILGYSREDLEGMAWGDLLHPHERAADGHLFQRMCAGEDAIHVGERVLLGAGGRTIHAHLERRAVCATDGTLRCCAVILRDMTHLRQFMRRTQRLRRVEQLLGQVNQAIVREVGLRELLHRICHMAVEVGGFSACWIGLWEAMDVRSLRLFARAGADVGDVDPQASAGEWLPGDGQRENPLVLNDLEVDSGDLSETRAAAQAGQRALARFTLGRRGAVTGTLNLFADEPGVFSEQVKALLREMAGNLSLAVDRITAAEALETARKVVESSPVVVCRWIPRPGWPLEYISANVARWGYSAAELVSRERPFMELMHPRDRGRVERELHNHIRHRRRRFRREYRLGTARGDWLWIEDYSCATYGPDGGLLALEGVLSDITERRRHERREVARNRVLSLLAHGADLQLILEALAEGVQEVEEPIAQRCAILLTEEGGAFLRLAVAPGLPPGFRSCLQRIRIRPGVGGCARAAATRQTVISHDIARDPAWAKVLDVTREAGVAACWAVPILASTGEVLGVSAIFRAVAGAPDEGEMRQIQDKANLAAIAIERTRDSQSLRENAERWRFAIEGAGDGVWDWDLSSDRVLYSRRCDEILELPQGSGMSRVKDWVARVHPEDQAPLEAALDAHLQGQSPHYVFEHRVRTGEGAWKWILARGLVVRRDAHGRPLRMVGTVADISERKRLEEELRALATTDYLTGLANRRHFLARVSEELARLSRHSDNEAAVLMLDLDHFKSVNDRYGHSAGDAVLRHFAGLLREGLRRIDLPGRVGGEEFAVLLPDAGIQDAQKMAERLRARLAQHPVAVEGACIPVTVSIGITRLRPEDPSPDEALQRADTALYRAKSSGRDCVRVFERGG